MPETAMAHAHSPNPAFAVLRRSITTTRRIRHGHRADAAATGLLGARSISPPPAGSRFELCWATPWRDRLRYAPRACALMVSAAALGPLLAAIAPIDEDSALHRYGLGAAALDHILCQGEPALRLNHGKRLPSAIAQRVGLLGHGFLEGAVALSCCLGWIWPPAAASPCQASSRDLLER